VDSFTERELALLRDLARQAAVAVEACRLTLDLQRSREKLVVAREEERRRLRGDLHDGVGPGLPSGERPAAILDALAQDLVLCSKEIRSLVDQLRPASLDQGLPEALRLEARRFTSDEFTVEVCCDDEIVDLPAAVEVAAFRIAAEALTNASKHSSATRCELALRCADALELHITDDGDGIPERHRDGVGLGSMRERAEELGGELTVCAVQPHGTRVAVRLPLNQP
jgi:signal transduction histidine kinase